MDDDELLSFARRDPSAFGTFYERHERLVLGYFMRRTRDPELATGVALIAAGGLYPSAEATVDGVAHPISTPCSKAVTARSLEVRLETRTNANRSHRRLLLGMIAGQLTVYCVLH